MPTRSKARTAPTVDEYLSPFPDAIRAIAGELRTLMNESIPGLIEAVYPGWKLIGYRAVEGRGSRYIGYIAPFEDRVVLGFEHGTLLADPTGILRGNGTQVRYVELRSPKDIDRNALRDLIMQAAIVRPSRT